MKKKAVKYFVVFLALAVCVVMINQNQILAVEKKDEPKIISTETIESDKITKYDDGMIVSEALDQSTLIVMVPSYANLTGQSIINNEDSAIQPRIAWLAIAELVIDWTGKVMTVCTVLNWLADQAKWPAPCRIATYATTGAGGNYLYSGRYIPGKIPGCEPSHSLPCNSGYYEYKFTR